MKAALAALLLAGCAQLSPTFDVIQYQPQTCVTGCYQLWIGAEWKF